MQRYEYDFSQAKTVNGSMKEIQEHAAQGWRVVSSYFVVNRGDIIVIFERPVTAA